MEDLTVLRLLAEISDQEDKIDKAIEYIENKIKELKEEHLFIEFTKEELYTLLNILKGSDEDDC